MTLAKDLFIIFLMSLTPRALVLLNAQRQYLDDQPHEREVTRNWAQAVDEARSQGELIVFIQWDGEAQGDHATFTRPWTLHPDFRAEEGDLLLRAVKPDAFQTSSLEADLKAHAVQELRFLALEGSPEVAVMAGQAARHGFTVREVQSAPVA